MVLTHHVLFIPHHFLISPKDQNHHSHASSSEAFVVNGDLAVMVVMSLVFETPWSFHDHASMSEATGSE